MPSTEIRRCRGVGWGPLSVVPPIRHRCTQLQGPLASEGDPFLGGVAGRCRVGKKLGRSPCRILASSTSIVAHLLQPRSTDILGRINPRSQPKEIIMEHLVWDKNLTPQDFLVLQSLADDIKAHSASSSNGHSQCHTDSSSNSSSKVKQTATNGANGDALRRKPVPNGNGNGNGVANGRQNQNATKLNDADNAMQANKAMSMLPSKP